MRVSCSLRIPARRLESRLDVVAQGQRQLGRGGDDACQANGRTHRDQGPDDLVDVGASTKLSSLSASLRSVSRYSAMSSLGFSAVCGRGRLPTKHHRLSVVIPPMA